MCALAWGEYCDHRRKSLGLGLIQDLRQDGVAIEASPALEGDKAIRLRHQSAKFQSGFVKLPKDAYWLESYVQELTAFPASRYDDQVDSTVYALAWKTQHSQDQLTAWDAYVEMQEFKPFKAAEPLVRVRATKFCPATNLTFSGRMESFFCDSDGVFLVPECEVPALLSAGMERVRPG
jgi:hypothetical protein